MAKNYKEMSTCTMCKQRYTVIKDKEANIYMSSRYCGPCTKKYFAKKETAV